MRTRGELRYYRNRAVRRKHRIMREVFGWADEVAARKHDGSSLGCNCYMCKPGHKLGYPSPAQIRQESGTNNDLKEYGVRN